jgi:hypothetical protein
MSTFTGSELEFLAGLNKSWWTLYWNELARLVRGKGTAFDPRQEAGAADRSKGAIRGSTANILAFTPKFPACDAGAACPLRRRNGTDGGSVATLQRRVELAAGNR